MFKNPFKRKQVEKKSAIGRQVELVHDVTVYQYGTVFIDGVRYSVKTEDKKIELCKGTLVEVLAESNTTGIDILTVRKVDTVTA